MSAAGYLAILLLALWFWKQTARSAQQKQYQPLGSKPGAFRVLELFPGEADDLIRVRLQVVTIGSAHHTYEALSYAWDRKPITRQKISLGLTDLLVTKGLTEILAALRYQNQPRRLWIDQICINQKDSDEKSSQMEMMREIYQNASRTIVWLGKMEKEQESTVTSLLQLCKPLRIEIQTLAKTNEEQMGSLSSAYYFSAHMQALCKHDTKYDIPRDLRFLSPKTRGDILSFFNRRWFIRLWPFQEVIVSKSELIVRYGQQEAEWADVGFLAVYLVHSNVLDPVAAHDRRGLLAANGVHFYWLDNKIEYPLIEMLRAARKYDAEEASDKVFAVLGLSREVQQLRRDGVTLPLSLRIDTTLTTSTVYRRIARFLLGRDQDLMMLSFVQHADDTISTQLPSWVPDWSQGDIGTQLWIPGLRAAHRYDAKPGSTHTNDSLVSATQESNVLQVSGVQLTKIDRNPLDCMTGEELGSINTPVHGNIEILVRWMAAMSGTTREEQMLVLTTGRVGGQLMCQDRTHTTDGNLNEYIKQFGQFVDSLAPWCAKRGMPLPEIWDPEVSRSRAEAHARSRNLPSYRIIKMGEDLLQRNAERRDPSYGLVMREAVSSACRERRLFSTPIGKWCLGPAACRRGDLVCILDGGRVPFVLRELSTSHGERICQLVGECYVSDFMFGEVNDIRPPLPKQKFLLR